MARIAYSHRVDLAFGPKRITLRRKPLNDAERDWTFFKKHPETHERRRAASSAERAEMGLPPGTRMLIRRMGDNILWREVDIEQRTMAK